MTARPPVTVISSIGNPRDRKTWSTTPASILAALDRAGVPVVEHVVAVPRPLQYAYAGAGLLAGLGRLQPDRVGGWAAHLRRAASRIATGPGTYLHFGSSHLPLARAPADQRHYLVTDYSIHLLIADGKLGRLAPPRYRAAVLATEAAIAAQVDAVFTISDYVRDHWIDTYKLPPAKAVAIGTGLGNPLTLDGHAKDYAKGHLLFVAKHGFDIKGGPLLLAGFLEALKTRPDLRLAVIADAADPTLIPHLRTMRDHPSIDFHQSGTPHFVDLVRGAALYAAPGEREPWGLIYLESLMCETPVLGLDRGAMRELTDDGRVGFIVTEATRHAVAHAILDAKSDPVRLARMGAAGRAFVESTFTWDHVAARILARMDMPPTR